MRCLVRHLCMSWIRLGSSRKKWEEAMQRYSWIVSVVLLMFAASMGIATAAGCKDPGSPSAKTMDISGRDNDLLMGLSVALTMGLTPATFPEKDIAAVKTPCKRGEFSVGTVTYSLYGTGDLPPRWAVATGANQIAFIAELPQPA